MTKKLSREDQDQEFKDWHSQNPEGFYLNQQEKNVVMLHKVGCWHLEKNGPWPPSNDRCATTKFKVISDNREELEAWAKEKKYKLKPCGHCKL